jgi:Rrf2 family protein
MMHTLFSRQCEYALQAVMYLAVKQNHYLVSIRELTEKLHIPYHFLAKILQDLTHKGLLVSHKGTAGGFQLALQPEKITLFHIIEAIDGKGFTNSCILGFEECSQTHPCALHEQWSKSRDAIIAMLTGKNIAEMASDMKKPQYQHELESSGG